MKNDNKTTDHHGFCENPESKCTLNYCDENGCTERKRYLVDLVTPTTMSDKETKERIESEGRMYGVACPNDRPEMGYVFGATSERPKAWNDAIDACISDVQAMRDRSMDDTYRFAYYLVIDALTKHKQP